MMDIKIKEIEKKTDERGWLIEFLHMNETPKKEGQFYVTTQKPGIVRGNHYHKRKNEWFGIIKGKAIIALKDMKTGETEEVELDEGTKDKIKVIYVPKNIVHAIKCIGDEPSIMIAFIDEEFDEKDPDTYFEKIIE